MILVTGGAGYIGSHTVLELLNAGYEVVVLDNLSNSSIESINRIQQLAGKTVQFIEGDIRDAAVLERVFSNYPVQAVLHFAGLKSVFESIEKPGLYYENNVLGSFQLLKAMEKAGVNTLIFSSSATVYGTPETVPVTEDAPVGDTVNPYGTTKYLIERMVRDFANANPALQAVILRYFNPAGAHESGRIGEHPNGVPNNLIPYISQVAVGELPYLTVHGNDYPTKDGTGVRDYIHVVDLAQGHVAALSASQSASAGPGVETYNLGTGVGYSVLEVKDAFEQESGKEIPFEISGRREGDIATCYADPQKANQKLGWKAGRTLQDMMRDAWAWQRTNPKGYNS